MLFNILFKVEGMTCASCVIKIENHMRKIPGITSVTVVLLTNRARIQYDSSKIGPRDILKYIVNHKNIVSLI
jgi:Cu+-exporting ATPase